MNERELFCQGAVNMGIDVSEQEQERLLAYLALLQKWNKVYNLTAIRDPLEMVSHHLLDSLAVLPYLWPKKWLDVGCGGGLPGIVLAIMRPDWQFSLLDSNSKKTSFVQQAVIELGLSNVSVHCERIESWKTPDRFDGIISRAFTDLGEFLHSTQHLLTGHGRWAAMKGVAEKELAGVPGGCLVERIVTLQVPGLNAARSLVIATSRGSEAA